MVGFVGFLEKGRRMEIWRKVVGAAFAAALLLGGQVVLAGSTVAQLATSDSAEVAAQLEAAVPGVNASAYLVESSGGTLLAGVGAATGDTATNIQNFFDAAITGGTLTASQVEAGLSAVSGVATALPGAQVGSAINNAIGGTGGVVNTRQSALFAERRGMVERFGSDAALASSAMNCNLVNRIWFSPFYTKQKGDQNKQNEAYDFDAVGVSLGYDRAFGNFTVGGSFTYSNGDYDVKDVADDNSIDSYGVSLYGQYYAASGIFGTLSAGYTYSDNNWNRFFNAGATNGWLRGDNHTDSYWVGGSVGKDFTFGGFCNNNKIVVTPSVGLFWSDSRGSAYNTSGALAQIVGTTKVKSLLLPIDIAVRYTRMLSEESSITFKAQGGYSYDFKNDGGEGTIRYAANGPAINVIGAAPGRHGWNVGAGVNYRYRQFDVGVDYRYDGRKKFDGHRVSATVGINF